MCIRDRSKSEDIGLKNIFIETGSGKFFEPARKLFKSCGFEECEPFGHYKKFACNLSPNHHTFFNKCEIYNEDAVKLIRTFSFKEGDFLFLDPPYLDRLGYSTGDGSDGLHERLASVLNEIDVPWLLIHSDCDFIRKSYSQCKIDVVGFKYAQNFGKGKDHSNAKVNHLYVSSDT